MKQLKKMPARPRHKTDPQTFLQFILYTAAPKQELLLRFIHDVRLQRFSTTKQMYDHYASTGRAIDILSIRNLYARYYHLGYFHNFDLEPMKGDK